MTGSDWALWRRLPFCRLCLLAWLVPGILLGCAGSQGNVNPQLQITERKDITAAVDRGKSLWGRDPYLVYQGRRTQQVNNRLSQNVIVRTAFLSMPADEVAFTVASLPAGSDDQTIKQAVDAAVEKINRQLKFVVVLQLLATADPKQIAFGMKTDTGQDYPPVATAEPQLLQQVPASPEDGEPATSMYRYQVYFQTVGSPGYPALDTGVTDLYLTVKDSGAQEDVHFSLMGKG